MYNSIIMVVNIDNSEYVHTHTHTQTAVRPDTNGSII